ncbi:sulfur carrier protein ThiS [Mycobacterium sp. E2479]|uniref:sulfur carrier protein ThiS n=1 Tax=Mycobacterium sp. E2479 TaxID=1834134 RepID=UPI000801F76E|nr:sulfur carrier protein ThiS [Mycobacterium sp. E2479]OBH57765.1 thiamine biosynthesis protein ThiS [Mycobacterium sp. E2479]
MIVVVNEQKVDAEAHVTVAALLHSLGFPDRGVAVAMDDAVLPRSRWSTELFEGDRLEVVTAVQGG